MAIDQVPMTSIVYFKVDFLVNETLNEKTLLYIFFSLIFVGETVFRPVVLSWQLSDCGFCQYHLMTRSAIN